jgi:hypothetical protein
MRFLKHSLPLLIILLTLVPFAPPAQAQEEEYGYLWSLFFDFESNYNGLLTIEVGPWKDGDLVSVDATSTATVTCKRVGNVSLNGGDAVFNGGYLKCDLDLARIVAANHGLLLDATDSYGSILLRSDIVNNGLNVAPIVSHPDANYAIDFTQTWMVRMRQQFTNSNGPQSQEFITSVGNTRNPYTFEYECVWLGACDNTFQLAGNVASPPAIGGGMVQFRTGPTTFFIGGDGGANTFSGRMGSLLIDPGNTVH